MEEKEEEEEWNKTRFIELLSNGGVARKVVELLLAATTTTTTEQQQQQQQRVVSIDGLDDFLDTIESVVPALAVARNEIDKFQSVSFYPGLGELFRPGSQLVCYPLDGGTPLGCSCVQSWYASSDYNPATKRTKRRFVLVIEFIVSVGDELVFVAMTDVYPEFHDTSRNLPLKDLSHRKLCCSEQQSLEDRSLLDRLQQRGEFYASVATQNHFLQYSPDSFVPIVKGWSSSSSRRRPLSKGGRVMVDVKRGIMEGHLPVPSSSNNNNNNNATSDTVKEAIKLFESSKRTGIPVPFRTCVVVVDDSSSSSDYSRLWMCWPMLVGFSFTARVWGKLLLGLPQQQQQQQQQQQTSSSCGRKKSSGAGNCGYIDFQTRAFDQLVLEEDKKELIRAVARSNNNNNNNNNNDNSDDDDDDDDDDMIDVVANKGGASIFLLHGPPGCGKTLTAEAIAELLEKPLYIVTAGDLGISASEVETNLGSVLELCQTWDALVLIDEADVFLEARNSTEIARNALGKKKIIYIYITVHLQNQYNNASIVCLSVLIHSFILFID